MSKDYKPYYMTDKMKQEEEFRSKLSVFNSENKKGKESSGQDIKITSTITENTEKVSGAN